MRYINASSKVARHLAAAFLMAGVAIADAHAGVEIGLGLDDPVNDRMASVLTLAYVTQQRFPWEFAVGSFSGRAMPDPHIGLPTTYFAAVSKRLAGAHWFVSEGLAYDTANDFVLSGHWQFLTSGGYRFDPHWTISARHMSNASTQGHNHGETFALLEYAF